ncbi:MAG TPA: type III-A CRISPR-associated RAMP protein Csm3, partial [Spirochaetota bacterium]|nr:type III-A CRISPR-associated RAMP protein Csm3 [Spirochaetota bacterium]
MGTLEKIEQIKGKIILKTGLHIGCGTEGVEIGGIDNPVIKDPRSGYPYIPGSSIKGKMRCLLELRRGIRSQRKEAPCSCGDCDICRVFGNTGKDSKVGVTRAVFRDAFLSQESVEVLKKRNLLATEAKTENSIDRIKGTGLDPRVSERAIAGLGFDFEIAVRRFEGDGDGPVSLLREGLAMVQRDALGGSGS